ncbi:hypothetical protein [Paracoccus sp. SM22M-07]|uniref:hypothetical protein n=1 Tax=Paracoccus sp. SM22M-07 TaxID=1520813 RepID=UPI0009242531|nr:hypothetical protein [Paracoccus sp. SM22M-07]OJH45198.1 hypothetical protein IE00_05945 [Paracoccus sp. SM22M-07]
MKRRDILSLAPALVIPAALPARADAELTPVMALFRKWLELDAIEARAFAEGADESAQDAAIERKMEIERLMMDAPKVSFIDVALTAVASSDFGGAMIDSEKPRVWRHEARVLAGI